MVLVFVDRGSLCQLLKKLPMVPTTEIQSRRECHHQQQKQQQLTAVPTIYNLCHQVNRNMYVRSKE